MNTFGLKKKGLSQFWLKGGNLTTIIISVWKDVANFTVYLKRKLHINVEF